MLVIQPIVFCKAPVPGRVKTRLMPAFSPEAAARLHAAMAECVIRRALARWPWTWVAADDPSHPFFQDVEARVVAQGEGDLGDRMGRCARMAFDLGRGGVLLLGTDSPHMSRARMHMAERLLEHADVVLGPVEDGGYDLLAMRGMFGALFQGIPWGSAGVRATTLQRAREAGLSVRLLSMGFDVDTPADVARAGRLVRDCWPAGVQSALSG